VFESVSTVREVDNMRVIQHPEPVRVHDGCQVLWGSVSHPHSRVEAVPNRAYGSSSDDVGINWSLSEIRLRVLPEINISFCTNNLKM